MEGAEKVSSELVDLLKASSSVPASILDIIAAASGGLNKK